LPFRAACLHILSSHGQFSFLAYCNSFKLPLEAASTQISFFNRDFVLCGICIKFGFGFGWSGVEAAFLLLVGVGLVALDVL
jgi:hypothetical protein